MGLENEFLDQTFVEGAISVSAVLNGRSRAVYRVFLDTAIPPRLSDTVVRLAASRGVPLIALSRAEIDELASGSSHGGILAEVGPRITVPIEDLAPKVPRPWIAMIDGVEDPYNFGASVRSLYAAGADGLVLRSRNWMSAAAVVAKSSAGASELLPTSICDSAEDAADYYSAKGYAIACATDQGATVSLYSADLTQPLFLLIGGEKRGITRGFLRKANLKLRIPYGRDCAISLGTVSAAAVIGFEVARQRGKLGLK